VHDEGDDVSHSDSVLIPTEDTLRFTYLIDQLTRRSMPVCLLGGTGSGKSSVVKEYLSNLKQEEWEMGQLVLSATTSATSVQEFLESKLEK
jgi:dynein heavy chain